MIILTLPSAAGRPLISPRPVLTLRLWLPDRHWAVTAAIAGTLEATVRLRSIREHQQLFDIPHIAHCGLARE